MHACALLLCVCLTFSMSSNASHAHTLLPLGHKDYLGFIYMDYCYNNPVMHVFSHLLEHSIDKGKKLETEVDVELVGADILDTTSKKSKTIHSS